jgi:transcription antitermination factor NusA-like protein
LSVFAPYEILKYNIRPAVGDERAHITVVIPREAQSAACGIHGSNTHVCAELLNASIDIVDPETVAELAEQGFSTNYITPDYSSTPLRFNKGDRNNAGGGFSNRSNSSGPREFRPRFNQQPDVRNESK